jgi:hypothetical protein
MLALLPLDNRPCNTRFPQQIAHIGSDDLLLPPDTLLGLFNTPGKPDALTRWLEGLPPVRALIVSVDMLAYGGLVASRHTYTSESEALARLEALRRFRAARPQTPILAFNILMRLAVTMDSDAAVANYYNIMRFARLIDEAERFHSETLRDELHRTRAQIPPDVMTEYLGARARNHAVNLRMLSWLQEGVFDFLLITQEDASEFGLHRREQAALARRAEELGVTNWTLHPGADEAALTLLAREWNTGVSFWVRPSSEEAMGGIAPFEDRPYEEALRSHVAAMCGEIVSSREEADWELWVNAPVGGSQKDETPERRETRLPQLHAFCEALQEAVEAGRRVALCDVGFPNGADNALMEDLERRGVLGKLGVFGGWNTAGNTTGTVLAQCAALKKAEAEGRLSQVENLSREFVFERLVDDWYYQARVRARVEKSARAEGISPLNMGDAAGPSESLNRRELRTFAQFLASRHFGTRLDRFEATLPWGRSFETDVRVKLV